MTAEQTGPPEVEIIEAGAERLDDVGALWRAMHEYHAEVAGEAREVAPFRRAEDSCSGAGMSSSAGCAPVTPGC